MTVEPRFHTQRNHERKTLGPKYALIAEKLGKPFMPRQHDLFNVAKEIDPITGELYYDLVIVTVQRQAGKTTDVTVDATGSALIKPKQRLWYTAQRGKYASDWMKDEHEPLLANSLFRDKYIFSRSLGSEAIRWPNGSIFKVFPPKRDAMHSKQSDRTYIDEAWAFTMEQGAELKQAVRPTMITRKGSQLWILSTMGDDLSLFFNDYVDLGRESLFDPKTRICYVDYGIPENADPEDLEVIAAHHPAYGHTITMEALEAARLDFKNDVAGWARAYGNRPTFSRVAAFPSGVWEACGSETPERPKRFGIGFDVTPSGDRATVSAAWRDSNGNVWIEVLRDLPGSAWVSDFVIELANKYRVPVGYDTAGIATLSVADEIARNAKGRVQLVGLTTVQFATACATFASNVMNTTLRHSRQRPMDSAVAVASRRRILDGGWAWGRMVSTGSIAPLVSATVAVKIFDDLPAERILTVMTAQ